MRKFHSYPSRTYRNVRFNFCSLFFALVQGKGLSESMDHADVKYDTISKMTDHEEASNTLPRVFLGLHTLSPKSLSHRYLWVAYLENFVNTWD